MPRKYCPSARDLDGLAHLDLGFCALSLGVEQSGYIYGCVGVWSDHPG
jgi:hypothetical protein